MAGLVRGGLKAVGVEELAQVDNGVTALGQPGVQVFPGEVELLPG